MKDSQKIRLLVDDLGPIQTKSALPFTDLSAVVQKTVEVGARKLKTNVNKMLAEITHLLSSVPSKSKEYELKEIKFSLSIDASGEVSLVSVAKGSLTGHTGIEFTLVKNN